MRVYQCDSCNKVISNPHNVKMKEFYLGVDTDYFSLIGIATPVARKRKIKIQLCDECYKGLNLIGGLVPKNKDRENND